ncbi:nicotinamide/nicotinic acid mononucleotide adenylyltransferase 1-like isoform X2 [Physella acuta]|uniref:nicotinamide/nicotinic acid mononucleotide adenylyltransferase 1-like isoform X2 n=1 Tax=Physella acuta TaxID=109671 RepID=UPI0027DD647D|nr:nicotinamide/nicotinic acid mononucleotide adenylyltransferase 1-like isoform X2 [Physella acuta]
MFCWKSNTMISPSKVVLLGCGSYSPVTNMHLRMFEIARDALNKTGRFQVTSGIMSPVSDGYKKKDLVPAKHRCEMLKAALKSTDWIKLDTWECQLSAWSQTAKVLKHFKEQVEIQFGHKPSPSKKRRKQPHSSVSDITQNQIPNIDGESDQVPCVKLLCGGDLLESFAVPGLWEEEDIEYIVGTHGLVVITRSGSDPQKFIYESDILTKFKENIFIVTEWITNDISSTKIRRALKRGESVKYLLQDSVIDYIREHQLYGVPDNKYINHMMPSPNGHTDASVEAEDQSNSSSPAEISVVLRSSPRGGYETSHLTLHRMTTTLDKRASPVTRLMPTHNSNSVPCFSDLGMLVRRVKNVRVGFTPETCV